MKPTSMTLPDIFPLDLAAERASLGPALEDAVLEVLRSGQYVLGPEAARLEEDFAQICGTAHGVAVSSGTEALILALAALEIGPGHNVVTSPFSFFATASTIRWVGADVKLADVEYDTALLDADAAASAVDAATRAIMPVHLYGQMADVARLASTGLPIVEDAAQAHGAQRAGRGPGARIPGTAACLAAFSFYPTKNLGTAGEGGLVTTHDADLAQAVRLVRDHGSPTKYTHTRLGTNGRMSALQAAVLNVKLPYLEGWNERRNQNAHHYDQAFRDSEAVRPLARVPDGVHCFHQYTVRIDERVAERDRVLRALAERGVHCGVHYPTPIHLQPVARDWGYREGDFPNAERLSREVLCLPVHPFLAPADVDRIAETLLAVTG
ncbi:MAG: DegT/DnrJ/EryC1/StrS family aminotransferase [Planctomycetota bacterium]